MRFAVREVPLDWSSPAGEFLTAELPLSADEVWARFIADPATWPTWFPGMARAAWHGDVTAQVGALRDVYLRDGMVVREKILAWEPGRRFGFSIVRCSRPLMAAMTEDYTLVPTPGGCRFEWRVKVELVWWLRPFARVVVPFFRPTFDDAVKGLVAAASRPG